MQEIVLTSARMPKHTAQCRFYRALLDLPARCSSSFILSSGLIAPLPLSLLILIIFKFAEGDLKGGAAKQLIFAVNLKVGGGLVVDGREK